MLEFHRDLDVIFFIQKLYSMITVKLLFIANAEASFVKRTLENKFSDKCSVKWQKNDTLFKFKKKYMNF